MKLTAAAVDRLKPDPTRRLEVPDTILPGLYLLVQPSGAKSWAVRYRFGGRTRKFTLGPIAVLGVIEARERARDAFQQVAAGRDPAAERNDARNGRSPSGDLVPKVFEEFLARHVRLNNKPKTIKEVVGGFRRHVEPAWGDRTVQSIKRPDVLAILDAIVDRGHPSAAMSTRARLSKFFAWCVQRGIDSSPIAQVGRPAPSVSRDRVLADAELRFAWLAAFQIG